MDLRLVKPLLLITVVLVLPIALLLATGEAFEAQLLRWETTPPNRATLAAGTIAILAADVFLPVPSGPVSTLAGSQLGVIVGTVVSCVGMTLGASIAFGLARRWGRPLAERLSSPERLAQIEAACEIQAPWMLVLTRPLPVLAEAAALLMGVLQMPWRTFLPPVVLSNLAIAAAYSALGSYATHHGWLLPVLCATIAVPVAAAAWWSCRL